MTVIVTATRLAASERVAATMHEAGLTSTVAMELDVCSEASVCALFDAIDSRFGRLDVLVNNAGIAPRVNGKKALVENTSLDMWNSTLATNLTGTFLVTRSAISLMKRGAWGRIINMSSRAARTRSNLASAYYAASKAGVIGFTRILADEVGPFGITANSVAPTRIATPMALTVADPGKIDAEFLAETPMRRLGQPADVSAVVAFLASEQAGFISGAILDVTGGQFMP